MFLDISILRFVFLDKLIGLKKAFTMPTFGLGFLSRNKVIPRHGINQYSERVLNIIAKEDGVDYGNLKTPIVKFGKVPSDHWTLEDAVRGTQIFGGIGRVKAAAAVKPWRSIFWLGDLVA